jgi:hypothetical protein
MRVVVSPYHLTTREPPVMAALLLAERVATLVPAPFSDRSRHAVESAARRSPRYLGLMESWRWSMPLWTCGLVAGDIDDDDASDDVRAAWERVARDDALRGLRPLMRESLFEDEARYLDAVAHDVLRGGPDPGVSVPVAAGLDALAARHGWLVARAEPVSVAQRAEAALGARVFSVAVPVLVQAGAERLLSAREQLTPELLALRAALAAAARVAQHAVAPDTQPDTGAALARLPGRVLEDLAQAAREYEGAFSACRADLLTPADARDPDEPAPLEGSVVLTGVVMPADAVLRSSAAAARVLAGGRAQHDDAPEPDAGDAPASVVALIVKRLGVGSRRAPLNSGRGPARR